MILYHSLEQVCIDMLGNCGLKVDMDRSERYVRLSCLENSNRPSFLAKVYISG